MKLHRNSQKRIIFEDACYFVTAKTYYNHPYFRERIFCDLFVENLRACKRMKGFLLYGWVLNFDHFHLLAQPNDEFDISRIMQFLKRNISRNINFIMGYNENDEQKFYDVAAILPSDDIQPTQSPGGDNDHCRLQITKDLNILEYIKIKWLLKFRFKIKYFNKHPFPKFRWQRSFFDEYMRNDNEFNNFLDYIVYNPEKHGLPYDWSYVFTNSKYDNLTDNIL